MAAVPLPPWAPKLVGSRFSPTAHRVSVGSISEVDPEPQLTRTRPTQASVKGTRWRRNPTETCVNARLVPEFRPVWALLGRSACPKCKQFAKVCLESGPEKSRPASEIDRIRLEAANDWCYH
jgi:hypothetical protein